MLLALAVTFWWDSPLRAWVVLLHHLRGTDDHGLARACVGRPDWADGAAWTLTDSPVRAWGVRGHAQRA